MQSLQEAGPNHIMSALEQQIPMIMFDGGAFVNIWGTMLVDLGILTDWQELSEPLLVQTAKGNLTLTTIATRVTLSRKSGVTRRGGQTEYSSERIQSGERKLLISPE